MADLTNTSGLKYPLTKMSFVVDFGATGTCAFSEVTGVESSVDVIEFRQGNANTLSLMKVPGLVHHGNVTMKYGMTTDTTLVSWFYDCVNSERQKFERKTDIIITLLDTSQAIQTSSEKYTAAAGEGVQWKLHDAWITKLNMPDLDAKTSDIAIASIEVAYERLEIVAGGAS